jgi:hypothetical protein
MPDYPQSPVPKSVSAPSIIDEVYRFRTDQSYEIRRSKHSRPRRRFTLEYLGVPTHFMRLIRDFLNLQRGGALPFSFWHPTAAEVIGFAASSPILIQYTTAHGLVTGQWVGIFESPAGNSRNGFYQVTRVSHDAVTLNGSTSAGSGVGLARVYLPSAVAVLSEDTFVSPQKLIGPEANNAGFWNFNVVLDELYA